MVPGSMCDNFYFGLFPFIFVILLFFYHMSWRPCGLLPSLISVYLVICVYFSLGTSKTELDLLQLGLAVLVSGSWRSMVSVSPSSAKKVYLHLCSSLLLDVL